MTDDDLFDPGPMDEGADNSSTGDDSSTASDDAGSESTDAPVGAHRGGGGGYARELVSKKILAKQRTFYIDLKESHNGKFIKISEVSRGGQRSTIMFDIEDLEEIIKALREIDKAA